MRTMLMLAAVLSACSQDPPLAATWGDAWTAWADGWCADTARCAPDYFSMHYPDMPGCRTTVLAQDCAVTGNCDEPYPAEKQPALLDCEIKLAEWPCGEFLPPDSCVTALIP